MTPWEKLVDEFGGELDIARKMEWEGIAYFVNDYAGPGVFVGGPLEEAAANLASGYREIEQWYYNQLEGI